MTKILKAFIMEIDEFSSVVSVTLLKVLSWTAIEWIDKDIVKTS